MLKLVFLAIWTAGLTVASSAGVAWWSASQSAAPAAVHSEKLEHKKARIINVPIITKGEVQGYVILQLAYVADAEALKHLPVSPEPYLLDEALEVVYGDKNFDFQHLERYDLKNLTKMLVERLRVRLKADVIKDVLIEEFNYVSKTDVRK